MNEPEYEYEVVRINKATGERQRIRFTSAIIRILNISEDEWRK